jgi:hypothetical protein
LPVGTGRGALGQTGAQVDHREAFCASTLG